MTTHHNVVGSLLKMYKSPYQELLDFNIQEKEIEVIGNINENKELLENE